MNANRSSKVAAARTLVAWSIVGLLVLGLVFVGLRRTTANPETNEVAERAAALAPDLSTLPLASPEGEGTRDAIEIVVPETSATVDATTSTSTEHAIRILVLDANQRAAEGVNVHLRVPSDDEVWAIAVTDAEGRGVLEFDAKDFSETSVMRVETSLVASTSSGVDFTTATIPSEELRFVLAPSGSIEFALQGGEEFPISKDAWFRISTEPKGCDSITRMDWSDTFVDGQLVGRKGRVAHVGLRACFTASFHSIGADYAGVTFLGPRFAGEVVHIDVPFVRAYSRITGRLLGIDGAPLARCSFEAKSRLSEGVSSSPRSLFETRTDDTGRFDYFVRPERLVDAGPRVEFRATPAGKLVHSAIVAMPPPLEREPGNTRLVADFGDVHVESEALLAAGRIVDARGKPLETWRQFRFQVHALVPEYYGTWSDVDAQTNDTGEFQIGLTIPLERFELRAKCRGMAPSSPVECVRGARDVLLVVRDPCRIEGQLLVPEAMDPDDVDLRIRRVDPAHPENQIGGGYETYPDGRFAVDALLPGTYSAMAILGDHELAVREVTLIEDGTTAKFEPIDLRAMLRPMRVTVVANGAPDITAGHITVLVNDAGFTSAQIEPDGSALLWTIPGDIDAIVRVVDCRIARFDAITDGARLVVETGYPFALRCANMPALPADCAVEIVVGTTRDDELAAETRWDFRPLASDGKAIGVAPLLGSYQVKAKLTTPDRRRFNGIEIELARPTTLEVTGAASPDELVIELDPESLRLALEQVRAR